ncbi:MAG: hypothetical protein R2810_06355 [Flavobacteriales bacterium]
MHARRFQKRQRNTTRRCARRGPLVDVDQSNYRFNATYKVSERAAPAWKPWTTAARTSRWSTASSSTGPGHTPAAQQVECMRARCSDGYDARVAAYESDLFGVFSIPYYGRGMRW